MKSDNYKYLAKFYDWVLWGNYSKYWEILNILFDKYINLNDSIKILDLWCWTWWILNYLNYPDKVEWIDLSSDMLNIAKKRFPNNSFYNMSFTDLNINWQYNFIYSIFDSLNHARNTEELYKIFFDVSSLLNKGWVFFFDFNTLSKFKTFNSEIYQIIKTEKDIISINREFIKPDCWRWNIEILTELSDKKWFYDKSISTVLEMSVEINSIVKELDKHFTKVFLYNLNDLNIFNIENNIIDINSIDFYRVWFLCIK